MKATYDKKADALSVQLLPDGVRETTMRVAPGILLHLDREKRPIELEIIGASEHYAPAELERLSSPVEWLTLVEASKEFGLSATTLRNQVLNEKIPATKSGRDWLVSRADMLTYLDNRSPSGRPARRKMARRGVGDPKNSWDKHLVILDAKQPAAALVANVQKKSLRSRRKKSPA